MPCQHYKDALIEVAASGGVSSGELRAHLFECASCREAFAEEQSLFAAIDSGLHAEANAEVPPSLIPRVRARLDKAVTTQRHWIQPFVFASAGVALAFLLLLVVRSHGPATNNVAKETPAVPNPMAPTAGMHKHISPSNVQVASTTPNHLHAPLVSTVKHSAASSNPEVLVPPDEREAFARFLSRDRAPAERDLIRTARAPEPPQESIEILSVEIVGLTVKPLNKDEDVSQKTDF
jgi:hypothetical protein